MARKYSIIVPTYNEEKDIFRTLNALEGIQWPDFEVLIVDDGSKDKTAEIVKKFSDRLDNFKFLPQPVNRGVSAVRNIGIHESTGEVVVVLNADVLLPKDFLQRIDPYYDQDNKWVAVVAKVINMEKVYPRLVEAGSHYVYEVAGKHWVWTEGFSCTKEAAIAVGLFPEAMPGCSGEDADFGLELEKRFKGVRAMEVVVPHIAPDVLNEFWGQQRGRGQGRTNYNYYIRHRSKFGLFINSVLATGWRLLKMLLIIPLTVRSWQFSKYSDRGRKDFFPFIWASYVTEAAMLHGMWRAFRRIVVGKK